MGPVSVHSDEQKLALFIVDRGIAVQYLGGTPLFKPIERKKMQESSQ